MFRPQHKPDRRRREERVPLKAAEISTFSFSGGFGEQSCDRIADLARICGVGFREPAQSDEAIDNRGRYFDRGDEASLPTPILKASLALPGALKLVVDALKHHRALRRMAAKAASTCSAVRP